MKELVLSILSSVFPIIGVAVMLFLEPELTEAIALQSNAAKFAIAS